MAKKEKKYRVLHYGANGEFWGEGPEALKNHPVPLDDMPGLQKALDDYWYKKMQSVNVSQAGH